MGTVYAARDERIRRIVAIKILSIRDEGEKQRFLREIQTLDRWCFGYFSVVRFLQPWARRARVEWSRKTYQDEFGDRVTSPLTEERPSIVAHSFGTFIVGNALLRYPYLRFNKVLLCGSILPASFPWDVIIERGQVQAVRNEYGSRDGLLPQDENQVHHAA